MNGPRRVRSNVTIGNYRRHLLKGILKGAIFEAGGGNDQWHKILEVEKSSFWVFVDDLPKTMSTRWLWQVFSAKGSLGCFLSRKLKRYKKAPFAFIRFFQILVKEAKRHFDHMNDF